MWCPILRLSNRSVWECAEEDCAWWVVTEEGAACAIDIIAEYLAKGGKRDA